jgi:hypothetical protein
MALRPFIEVGLRSPWPSIDFEVRTIRPRLSHGESNIDPNDRPSGKFVSVIVANVMEITDYTEFEWTELQHKISCCVQPSIATI